MDKFAFVDAVKRLALYYGSPADLVAGLATSATAAAQARATARVNEWFPRCKDIPTEAVTWIVGHIEENEDSFPRNLPKAMTAAWVCWRQAHPEKCAPKGITGDRLCPGGCDKGTLHYWFQTPGGRWARGASLCARCQGSANPKLLATKETLEGRGCRVLGPGETRSDVEYELGLRDRPFIPEDSPFYAVIQRIKSGESRVEKQAGA